MFGVSTLGTVSLEEIRRFEGPQAYQFFFHKDRALNDAKDAVARIRAELGYRSRVGLRGGVVETLAWYRTHGWL